MVVVVSRRNLVFSAAVRCLVGERQFTAPLRSEVKLEEWTLTSQTTECTAIVLMRGGFASLAIISTSFKRAGAGGWRCLQIEYRDDQAEISYFPSLRTTFLSRLFKVGLPTTKYRPLTPNLRTRTFRRPSSSNSLLYSPGPSPHVREYPTR